MAGAVRCGAVRSTGGWRPLQSPVCWFKIRLDDELPPLPGRATDTRGSKAGAGLGRGWSGPGVPSAANVLAASLPHPITSSCRGNECNLSTDLCSGGIKARPWPGLVWRGQDSTRTRRSSQNKQKDENARENKKMSSQNIFCLDLSLLIDCLADPHWRHGASMEAFISSCTSHN